jgi:hypothetical protein
MAHGSFSGSPEEGSHKPLFLAIVCHIVLPLTHLSIQDKELKHIKLQLSQSSSFSLV